MSPMDIFSFLFYFVILPESKFFFLTCKYCITVSFTILTQVNVMMITSMLRLSLMLLMTLPLSMTLMTPYCPDYSQFVMTVCMVRDVCMVHQFFLWLIFISYRTIFSCRYQVQDRNFLLGCLKHFLITRLKLF